MKKDKNQFRRFISGLILFYFVIQFIIRFSQNNKSDGSIYEETYLEETTVPKSLLQVLYADDLTLPSDSINFLHQRSWGTAGLGRSEMSYSMNLRSAKTESVYKKREVKAEVNRVYNSNNDYAALFRTIYGELYKHKPIALSHIADSLKALAIRDGLDKVSFANLIVSYVQDLPYWFIVSGNNCGTGKYTGYPCLENIPFGVLSPQEVGFSAFGDCDSKALYAYSLLRLLGFEPIIVVSREYEHAMLAINLPISGDYIMYNRKAFYFWEVTNTGWQAGMLPPSCSNKNYWKIALTYEY